MSYYMPLPGHLVRVCTRVRRAAKRAVLGITGRPHFLSEGAAVGMWTQGGPELLISGFYRKGRSLDFYMKCPDFFNVGK